jgi:hypothetical protein
LGTDYPFPLGESQPGKLIEEIQLVDAVKEKLSIGMTVVDIDLSNPP